jgi:WD40 repeat protein
VLYCVSVQIFATGSYDDTVKLYVDDPSDDWYDFATLSGHSSTVWSVAFSPCGLYIASASDDCTVRIWSAGMVEPEKGEWRCVHIIRGHEQTIYSISWGIGSAAQESLGWIASTGRDGRINVWDIRVRVINYYISAENQYSR